MASVGHVRDLPRSAPKGSKRADHPVPGVDLKQDFEPTYEVLPDKKKTITDLKKLAKQADDIWFATDLDREGEAIAWHLAQALGVPEDEAKRVVFNAITKSEIGRAFDTPRNIELNRVNAQQARRILDRIVGYMVSPLLWKKVAGGLSAGRVQSVATRIVVEREREIEAFVPDEYWKITGMFATEIAKAVGLGEEYQTWLDTDRKDQHGKPWPRSIKEKNAWLSEHQCIKAELVKIGDEDFKPTDRDAALAVAKSLGFELTNTLETEDPKAKGPQQKQCTFEGVVSSAAPDYKITSIQTKRTRSRPPGPFITSTMQQAASNRLGFALQRTMRIAQQLYEGIDLKGVQGQTGLITYMRTDSTHLSGEAINMARGYITDKLGDKYLPEKPNFFSSSNKSAQEAHEAIRPTDVTITPDSIKSKLSEEQFKLYNMIWKRFVACQMVQGEWDSTTILIEAQPLGSASSAAVFKATGRTLVFDGFMRIAGIPQGDDVVLPPLEEEQPVAPFNIDPTQHFTSPPARFTEASLQKKLEEEGIGRPSTYAAIIGTIQDRKYVEPVAPRDRRLMATDLGKVVTDMLVEAFPSILDIPFTRTMEDELDHVESERANWREKLHEFYDPFKEALDHAHENLTHAKAVTEPAPHTCPKCSSKTMYRFGKNGRFLSCTMFDVPPVKTTIEGHPGEWFVHKARGKARPQVLSEDGGSKVLWSKLTKEDKERVMQINADMPEPCTYAAPIDREGNPMEPEQTDIICPADGKPMIKRTGRFGPFLAAATYPDTQYIVKLDPKKHTVILPKPDPMPTGIYCPKCNEEEAEDGGQMVLRESKNGLWLACNRFPKCRGRMGFKSLEEDLQKKLEKQWAQWLKDNPVDTLYTVDGVEVTEGYMPIIAGSTDADDAPSEEELEAA